MTPLLGSQILASALYLLPAVLVGSFTLARTSTAEIQRGAGAHGWLTRLALTVPVVLGVDMLAILLVGFVVPLGVSVLVVRALWLVLALAYGLRTRKTLSLVAWSHALPPLALAALAGGLGTLPFRETSFTLNAWDREWHIPLATSLQGQRLPFANVFEPARLRYHYLGDVMAAILRELSNNVLSSPAALSLSHDLFFFLTGAWLTLLLLGLSRRQVVFAVFAGITVLLHGAGQREMASDYDGYAFHLFSRLSYRPHVPIALFAMVTYAGSLAVLAGGRDDSAEDTTLFARMRRDGWWPRLALLGSMFLLALSDETSGALFGAASGLAWLANPRAWGAKRVDGFVWLVVLMLALVLPNVLFTATLAPGGPVQASTWNAPRLASIVNKPALPLANRDTKLLLLAVLGPVLAMVSALAAALPSVRARGRLGMFVFPASVLGLGVLLGTVLTINGSGNESQRFFVAPFLAAIVPAVVFAPRAKGPNRRPLAFGLTALALAIPAVYTLNFLPYQLRTERGRDRAAEMGIASNKLYPRNLYVNDCRKVAGAPSIDRARAVYVDETGYMSWAGCRSSFVAGTAVAPWPIRIMPVVDSKGQLTQLLANQRGDTLTALCNREGTNDTFCAKLVSTRSCTSEGTWFRRCEFQRAEAQEHLSRP